MEDCIFCKIVRGEIPSIKVYENEMVLAFADINPLSDGHTLIIPKGHFENIHDIGEAELMAIHSASKKVAAAMKASLDPAGIACMQLNGRGVNQVVMHYHLHLIPRTESAGKLKITLWDLVPGDMDAIQKTAEKIAAKLDP